MIVVLLSSLVVTSGDARVLRRGSSFLGCVASCRQLQRMIVVSSNAPLAPRLRLPPLASYLWLRTYPFPFASAFLVPSISSHSSCNPTLCWTKCGHASSRSPSKSRTPNSFEWPTKSLEAGGALESSQRLSLFWLLGTEPLRYRSFSRTEASVFQGGATA